MLILPGPEGLPTGIWEEAETKEMEQVVGLYGKTYHFWQVDRGDKLPLGEPQLMMSLTKEDQVPGFSELLGERDSRYKVSSAQKKEKRAYIEEPEIHEDADSMWKESAAKGEQQDGDTKDQAPLIQGTLHFPSPSFPYPPTQLTAPRRPILRLTPLPPFPTTNSPHSSHSTQQMYPPPPSIQPSKNKARRSNPAKGSSEKRRKIPTHMRQDRSLILLLCPHYARPERWRRQALAFLGAVCRLCSR